MVIRNFATLNVNNSTNIRDIANLSWRLDSACLTWPNNSNRELFHEFSVLKIPSQFSCQLWASQSRHCLCLFRVERLCNGYVKGCAAAISRLCSAFHFNIKTGVWTQLLLYYDQDLGTIDYRVWKLLIVTNARSSDRRTDNRTRV